MPLYGQTFHPYSIYFFCAMPWRYPLDDIQSPADGVKDVAVSITVSLWNYGRDGSLWFYPNVVINIPPGFFTLNISTTAQTTKGELFLIPVSWSGRFVGFDTGWMNSGVVPNFCVSPEWVRHTYQVFYRPSYFSRKWDLKRLFYDCHQIPRGKFPKSSGQ